MKKIAYILGAVVLAAGSVSAVSSFADASVQAALASTLVSTAKGVEAQDRANGVTDESKIAADIQAALAGQIQAAVAANDSDADIQAAVTQAMNTSGLSAAQASGLAGANGQLASLEGSKPGGVGAGTGGGSTAAASPPAPPPPAAAGSGYTGS